MSKSFVELQDEILSVLVEAEKAKRSRLVEPDCHIKPLLNANLKISGSRDEVSLLRTLESIVRSSKTKAIHKDYRDELAALEPLMQRLRADDLAVQISNMDAKQLREKIIKDMDMARDEKIAKLTDNRQFYQVMIKAGKISQEKTDAVNAFFAHKGFTGPEIKDGWIYFAGLSDEGCFEIRTAVMRLIQNTSGYFIRQEVDVWEEGIAKAWFDKVEHIISTSCAA